MAPFSIVPPGFFAANEALNVLPNVTLSQLISDAQKLIKKEIESIPKASYRDLNGVTDKALNNAINACLHILRELGSPDTKLKDKKTVKALLERETDLSESVCETFAKFVTKKSDAVEEAKGIMGVGKLVDIKWKLGMGVSSNSCTTLMSPFVSLVLSVAEKNRGVRHHSFELTVQEFHDFRQTFKNMAVEIQQV
ncbi:hypothetical protein AAMO2058_000079000 [Amorphochlora amoebiformis]